MTPSREPASEPPPAPGKATLAELFAAHATFVWRVAASLGVPTADLQDVTQEVFLVAFRRLADWDEARASATSWLYGITVRIAANHRRLAHVRRERGDELPVLRVAPDPGADIDRARLLEQLDAALAELPPGRRDVFILFEIAEIPMQAVAETVGCPLKTAYKRLYAARRDLAARLGMRWGNAEGKHDEDT